MQESIFTKIIKGEIPCYKVFEDERTLAFLDIHPITRGHTLVIPKTQVDEFQNLDEEDYQAVMTTVRKVARRQKEVLQSTRIGLQVIGVDVPHAHIHLIPFNTVDEYRYVPDMSAEPNHAELAQIAEKLSF